MTLDLPRNRELFGQKDVRETETSEAVLTGTQYASIGAPTFTAANPDTDAVQVLNGIATAEGDGIFFSGSIQIPNGATITGAIVYASVAGAETWTLKRSNLATSVRDDIAAGNINAEDTSITNGVVDNSTYHYSFQTSGIDTNDDIIGARVTYTI